MIKEITMGIDIGSTAVKAVIAEKEKEEPLPRIIGTGIAPAQGLRKSWIVNPEDTALSIKEAVKKAREEAGVNIKNAVLAAECISLQSIKSKGSIIVSKTDYEITENDLKRASKQSEIQLNRAFSSYLLNHEILHQFPLNYKIDGELIIGSPLGMRGEKIEVETLFITCSNQYIQNLIKSAEIAGISIEDIVAGPLASSHLLLNQKEKEVGSILINIGGDISSIIIFEEGIPISLEIFPIGSNHITYDIARGFQILLEEAEKLKLDYGNNNSLKKKLTEIIEPRLNDIFELTENHLKKINRSKLLPAGATITGGGANLFGIEEIAKKSLALPVQLNKNKFAKHLENEIYKNPTWSTAIGLCFMNLAQDKSLRSKKTLGRLGNKAKNILFRWLKTFLP